MSFDKISTLSVRETFVREIENKILSGELKPGDNAQHDEDEQYHADQHRNGAQNALYHAFHTESLPFCPSQPLFPNCQSVKTMLCAGEHHFPRRRCFGIALL